MIINLIIKIWYSTKSTIMEAKGKMYSMHVSWKNPTCVKKNPPWWKYNVKYTRGAWLGFLNSCNSFTFYLVPPSWWISPHVCRVFLTHTPWVHFTLYLHHCRFLLVYVEKLNPLTSGHILPYASTVMDFSSHRSSFLNSYVLGTFCLVPSPWWISSHAS